MRILLTGRNGQVGSELERALPVLGEVIATDRASVDLQDEDSLCRVVREVRPDLIVNAAAYTGVDKAESEPGLAMQVNAIAPAVLGEEAKRLGALLVHYSTDYVFDGAKRSPYTEEDTPNPLNHYARTKLQGERAIVASGCRHLILRTSWVYSPRAKNFYEIIWRTAQANKAMRMVDDQTSVPTTSAFLAIYTVALLRRKSHGLLHLVPSGQASRYEFALQVVKSSKSSSVVEPVSSSCFPSAARRPAYSVMSNAAAAKLLDRPLPDWRESVARLLL